MKKTKISLLMLLVLSMSACSMFDSDEPVEDTKDDIVDKAKDTEEEMKEEKEENISKMFDYFDKNEVDYIDKEKLENMDFAAEEGYSFKYNDEYVYLYRLNDTDVMMQGVLDEATESGNLSATQNGVEQNYKAFVNGNYLMLHSEDASLDDLYTQFNKYE